MGESDRNGDRPESGLEEKQKWPHCETHQRDRNVWVDQAITAIPRSYFSYNQEKRFTLIQPPAYSMRILQLHNFYKIAGGEDVVVRSEKNLLEAHGNSVALLDVDNDAIASKFSQAMTAVNAIYSPASKQRVLEEINRFQPDIVHVHNFFPLLSPAVYDARREARYRSTNPAQLPPVLRQFLLLSGWKSLRRLYGKILPHPSSGSCLLPG